MTTLNTLKEVARCGINLALNGDAVRVEAPTGQLTPELRAALAQHKTSILLVMRLMAAWEARGIVLSLGSQGQLVARATPPGGLTDEDLADFAQRQQLVLALIGPGQADDQAAPAPSALDEVSQAGPGEELPSPPAAAPGHPVGQHMCDTAYLANIKNALNFRRPLEVGEQERTQAGWLAFAWEQLGLMTTHSAELAEAQRLLAQHPSAPNEYPARPPQKQAQAPKPLGFKPQRGAA